MAFCGYTTEVCQAVGLCLEFGRLTEEECLSLPVRSSDLLPRRGSCGLYLTQYSLLVKWSGEFFGGLCCIPLAARAALSHGLQTVSSYYY